MNRRYDTIRPVSWEDNELVLIDQRLLPQQLIRLRYKDPLAVAGAIKDMVVRGAPAIGITAAYGVVLAAIQLDADNNPKWKNQIQEPINILADARPTAVNLHWALKRMQNVIAQVSEHPIEVLLNEAHVIKHEDIEANYKMGDFGAGLIGSDSQIMTHCNAGALATGGYGTALGVVRAAYEQGKITQVYADETRPWLQGSRLTAWELQQETIPVTVIGDGAAAKLMRDKKPQWVIVGSDRIAANGDVANKIGTYSLIVNARHHGVKVMVAAPTSTIDMDTASGDDIPIEVRDAAELLQVNGNLIASAETAAWNPVFDVTPADMIDAIVTERGVIENPNNEKLKAMMQQD